MKYSTDQIDIPSDPSTKNSWYDGTKTGEIADPDNLCKYISWNN